MTNLERRFNVSDFEVRSEGKRVVIEGYASVFNKRSQNLGGFVEQVAPGAFAKTIQEADVRALLNHDANFVLGRSAARTLRLTEDGTGLHYEVDLPDTSYARDLAVSMERGDISQSSFGFRVIDDEWGFTEDDFPIRTLKQVQLFDVSPVTYPAYLDSSSSLGTRALERLAETRGLKAGSVEAIRTNLRAIISGGTDLAAAVGETDDGVEPDGTDADEDPGLLVLAIDAVLDEVMDALTEGDTNEATALLTAASASVDVLISLLGLEGYDNDDGERSARIEKVLRAFGKPVRTTTSGLRFVTPVDPALAMAALSRR